MGDFLMTNAAIIGFGTVGSGVYEIFKNNDFEKKIGSDINIKRILDIRDFEGHEAEKLFTKDFSDISNDGDISVVAETMGGLHPAYEFTKELLEKGKSVVTSNKELVATYGAELLDIAARNDVNYLFEASVGGGIPIIRPMTSCLLANNIEKIAGILNGTTNYILTEMFEKGKGFSEALKDAQSLGYAERNPAADVEGYDACRKIAILASLAWGKRVDYNDVFTEGITDIDEEDVRYAEEFGYVIKLIGYAEPVGEGVNIMVRPMLVGKDTSLAGVSGVYNAVAVKGDYLGEALFCGRGAGKEATASAVSADIIDCVKHLGEKKHNIHWDIPAEGYVIDIKNDAAAYMIRSEERDGAVRVSADKKAYISEKMSAPENKKAIRILEI